MGIIYPYALTEIVISGLGDRFIVGSWTKFTLWSWQKDEAYETLQRVALQRVCISLEDALLMRADIMKTPVAVLGREAAIMKPSGESSH